MPTYPTSSTGQAESSVHFDARDFLGEQNNSHSTIF